MSDMGSIAGDRKSSRRASSSILGDYGGDGKSGKSGNGLREMMSLGTLGREV